MGDQLTAVFSWAAPPIGVDGISMLVNDVERHRAFFYDGLNGRLESLEWSRTVGRQLNEYMRFAYLANGRTLDYTKAGILFSNGTWFGPR